MATFAAAPIVLFTAGPAAAAPDDVTLTASARGQTVTTTVTNNTGADIYCAVIGMKPGQHPERDPIAFSVGFVDGEFVPVAIAAGTRSIDFRGVPQGDYLVDWGCRDNVREVWGTPLMYSLSATAQAVPVTVARDDCFGSACLPTGFGS
ncbi:hypothetical protein [Rhodococcus sp. 14C212]|uniref:hypothetical protein n=1 Tax=Rhodococcus sp. 14C212 TaxID=2711209 RepID=UPI001F0CFC80|nr:hypothetical protein [Rhodococcus sp. 14C212]